MKNKTGKLKLNKNMLVLAISLAMAILISVGTVTYAVFTNSMYAQRTIAAYDNAGDRYSSNALIKGNSADNVRTEYVTNALAQPVTIITVCNYDQGNPASPNTDRITYSVTAQLVRKNGVNYEPVDTAYVSDLETEDSCTYSITVTHSLGGTINLGSSNVSGVVSGKTLPANEATAHSLTVTFSNTFAPNQPDLYLEIIVEAEGQSTLRGIFKAGIRAEGATNLWSGAFTDDRGTDENPIPARAYDGYNYRIMGTGSGTFTLTWDNSKVSLSYESLRELLSIAGATSTENSVTFPVDSSVASRYDIQFYKVNITEETWDQMNGSVVTGRFS
ncbi:MAG: hypothetical protein IKP68_08540 [Clostridia bacterium]|nr:hypothetical protein [Clostridia bacterium]